MLAIALTLLALSPGLSSPATPQEPPPGAPAGARATLESCRFEDGRWVCRYQMPDITVVPAGPDGASGAVAATAPTPVDVPALSRAEEDLVLRCAEASWLSLCTPAQRRTARTLQARAEAEAALRRTVGARMAAGDCAGAERLALEAGRLGLAAEARRLCRP